MRWLDEHGIAFQKGDPKAALAEVQQEPDHRIAFSMPGSRLTHLSAQQNAQIVDFGVNQLGLGGAS